jgi:hypothetical protein
MTTHTPCARDIWWTLDFASAFLSPGVNSRAELVPSPRAYARNVAVGSAIIISFWNILVLEKIAAILEKIFEKLSRRSMNFVTSLGG